MSCSIPTPVDILLASSNVSKAEDTWSPNPLLSPTTNSRQHHKPLPKLYNVSMFCDKVASLSVGEKILYESTSPQSSTQQKEAFTSFSSAGGTSASSEDGLSSLTTDPDEVGEEAFEVRNFFPNYELEDDALSTNRSTSMKSSNTSSLAELSHEQFFFGLTPGSGSYNGHQGATSLKKVHSSGNIRNPQYPGTVPAYLQQQNSASSSNLGHTLTAEESSNKSASSGSSLSKKLSQLLRVGLPLTSHSHTAPLSPSLVSPQHPNSSDLESEGTSMRSVPTSFQPQLGGLPPGASTVQQAHVPPTASQVKEMMQNRLRSLWNNMKYNWRLHFASTFSTHESIYLLGVVYSPIPDDPNGGVDLERFHADFVSRVWFSYRHDFPPLPSPQQHHLASGHHSQRNRNNHRHTSSHWMLASSAHSGSVPTESASSSHLPPSHTTRTSDCGWGCMLRTGQMLMAQALLLHFLSRDWRYCSESSSTSSPANSMSRATQRLVEDGYHRQILRWFGDSPRLSCPLSLHQLLCLSGQRAGQWFGPASVCQLLIRALRAAHPLHPQLAHLDAYLATDRQIFVQDVRRLFCSQQDDHGERQLSSADVQENHKAIPPCCNRALVVLIPLYLGDMRGFNTTLYSQLLFTMLEHPLCIGVIGGRPKHSLYIVGHQGQDVIFLDPHFSQPTVDVLQDTFPTHSFHCSFPRKVGVSRLDPSCAVGFYCRAPDHLHSLLQALVALRLPNNTAFPLVEVLPGQRPSYEVTTDPDLLEEAEEASADWRLSWPSFDNEGDFIDGFQTASTTSTLLAQTGAPDKEDSTDEDAGFVVL